MCVREYTMGIGRIGLKHGDISFLSEKERGQSRHTERERESERERERERERLSERGPP